MKARLSRMSGIAWPRSGRDPAALGMGGGAAVVTAVQSLHGDDLSSLPISPLDAIVRFGWRWPRARGCDTWGRSRAVPASRADVSPVPPVISRDQPSKPLLVGELPDVGLAVLLRPVDLKGLRVRGDQVRLAEDVALAGLPARDVVRVLAAGGVVGGAEEQGAALSVRPDGGAVARVGVAREPALWVYFTWATARAIPLASALSWTSFSASASVPRSTFWAVISYVTLPSSSSTFPVALSPLASSPPEAALDCDAVALGREDSFASVPVSSPPPHALRVSARTAAGATARSAELWRSKTDSLR
jgi:hypothetical protein